MRNEKNTTDGRPQFKGANNLAAKEKSKQEGRKNNCPVGKS